MYIPGPDVQHASCTVHCLLYSGLSGVQSIPNSGTDYLLYSDPFFVQTTNPTAQPIPTRCTTGPLLHSTAPAV